MSYLKEDYFKLLLLKEILQAIESWTLENHQSIDLYMKQTGNRVAFY